jgi:hypothetical protein
MRIKLRLCWAILRGNTVAYRLAVRDGGIDVSDAGRAHVVECTVTGGVAGLRL